jgi:hypothetical protein
MKTCACSLVVSYLLTGNRFRVRKSCVLFLVRNEEQRDIQSPASDLNSKPPQSLFCCGTYWMQEGTYNVRLSIYFGYTVKTVKLVTFITWPPVIVGHLYNLATCHSWPPVIVGRLYNLATCHSWPPVIVGHLYNLATCHSWSPL